MNQLICYCKNVTKAEIEKAIMNGAKTLIDIQNSTNACTGDQCSELNPSGKCCSIEIIKMLNEAPLNLGNTCCCCK